jgi:hypothetical protein
MRKQSSLVAVLSRRPRRVVLCAATAAVGVVCVSVLIFEHPLRESWYIRAIENYDAEGSQRAAAWLSRNGGIRTLRRLLEVSRRLAALPEADNLEADVPSSMVRLCEAMEAIVLRQRQEVVPLLIVALEIGPDRPNQSNQVRIGAANFLKLLGPEASVAIPALMRAAKDTDRRFAGYAAEALRSLQGP